MTPLPSSLLTRSCIAAATGNLAAARCLSTTPVARKRTLKSMPAFAKPTVSMKKMVVEEEAKRKARESAKGLKWNPVDDLIFGDRSNTALYNSAILEHVAWAFMTSELRSRMVGRGITVTRANVQRSFDEVHVYWATNQFEREDDTASVLADSAEEIRKIVKGKSGMRAVPKITFVKDVQATQLAALDREFNKVVESLKSSSEKTAGDSQQQTLHKSRWDAILALVKRTDTLRLKRDEILEQIQLTVLKQESCRTADSIPDPNAPPPQYAGYFNRGETNAKRKMVKKYIGDKRKGESRGRTVLENHTQPLDDR